eukprot:9427571-Ditylum_brightwellii.AAC.1
MVALQSLNPWIRVLPCGRKTPGLPPGTKGKHECFNQCHHAGLYTCDVNKYFGPSNHTNRIGQTAERHLL